MNTRLSRVSAAALLAVVLSLNLAPSAYAARRGDSTDPGDVRDRIVQFIRDIRHFFAGANSTDLQQPKP